LHLAPTVAADPANERRVRALIRQLEDKDPIKHREAVDRLAQLGEAARSATPALVRALNDPDRLVGPSVAHALDRVDPGNPVAGSGLAVMVRSQERLALLPPLLPVVRAVATPLVTGTVPGDFWDTLSQCRAELRLIQSEVELRRVLAAACLGSMG